MSKTTTSAFDPDRLGPPAKYGDDVVFVFSDFELGIDFLGDEDDFDEVVAREELLSMSREIWIDKTYVNFRGTKFKNVFLKEEGWDQLMQFVWRAKRNRQVTDHIVLRKAFESMIVAYMEHVAALLGYDPAKIEFWVDPDSDIRMRLFRDTAKEWLTYPGQWQDWPENN